MRRGGDSVVGPLPEELAGVDHKEVLPAGHRQPPPGGRPDYQASYSVLAGGARVSKTTKTGRIGATGPVLLIQKAVYEETDLCQEGDEAGVGVGVDAELVAVPGWRGVVGQPQPVEGPREGRGEVGGRQGQGRGEHRQQGEGQALHHGGVLQHL